MTKQKKCFVGIDTSNYTTSLAIISESSELVANLKCPLRVRDGERGLRQSDAVFSHTVNIPSIIDIARPYLYNKKVACIGVSEKPRNENGSYMPCFLVGISVAEAISAFLDVPLYRFSHQCGHIMAGIYSSSRFDLLSRPFGAFHVSGGTTELVRTEYVDGALVTQIVADTRDLNAGQVIDRIGVYLGLKFPAGTQLEELAVRNKKNIPKKKISIKDGKINLSGLENMAIKLYKDSGDAELTAAFVFEYIGRALVEMRKYYESIYGSSDFLYAGGVLCNSIIKKILDRQGEDAFAKPEMSSDNAVGVACLAMLRQNNGVYNGY